MKDCKSPTKNPTIVSVMLRSRSLTIIPAGAKQLCTVRSDLSGVSDSELEPRRQSRGMFSRSKKWFNCSYEVRATVGPADLTFELWYKEQKFSKNHTPIKVTWDEEGASSGPTPNPEPTSESGSPSGSSPAGSVSGLSSEDHSETR